MELMKQFEAQSKTSIWPFLNRFAKDKDVFMRECSFLRGVFEHNGIYLYISDDEIVVVMIDAIVTHPDELMDEEPFNDEEPLWFSEVGNRVSPIYRLRQVMKLLCMSRMDIRRPIPDIRGVLLSFSNLINLEDIEPYLTLMNVKAIGNLNPEDAPIKLHEIDNLQAQDSRKLDGREVMKRMQEYFDNQRGKLPVVKFPWKRHPQKEIEDEVLLELKRKLEGPEATLFNSNPQDHHPDTSDSDDDDDLDLDSWGDPFDLPYSPERTNALLEDPDVGDDLYADDANPPRHEYSGSAEDAMREELDSHLQEVYDNLDDQYPDILGRCNIYHRVEVRYPTLTPEHDFDRLVGCGQIRQQITRLTTMTRYNQRRALLAPEAEPHNVSLHALFTGNPGVGKSTVCKLYGSLLRKAGALTYGHVVLCDRSTFVGTHWGDEEKTVESVLQIARGGVLMVDEAYQLLGAQHPNDPGQLVLPLMMNKLADPKWRDLAVVLCGYTAPMQKLIDKNIGLTSRFPNHFFFKDFTIEELEHITLNRVHAMRYHFSRSGWAKYRWFLRDAYDHRNDRWANARFIETWLDDIYLQHAQRCEECQVDNLRQLTILTRDDICLPRRQ